MFIFRVIRSQPGQPRKSITTIDEKLHQSGFDGALPTNPPPLPVVNPLRAQSGLRLAKNSQDENSIRENSRSGVELVPWPRDF
jgi:hypothetical protein